jgi:hypothetical protein
MAIYPKMNLAQLRTASRQRADMVNSTFVSDDELNSYINASYFELYDLLVQKYGNDYYMKQYSFQLVGNQERYDLPDDFFKLLGVDLQISAGPDGYVSLRPFTLAERNRYSTANVQTWIGVTNLRYRLSANKLWFTPSPQTGQTIRIWYVPRLAELVDTTTLGINAPITNDYISIGSTLLYANPTVTLNSVVSGDYFRIGTIDLMAMQPTLTVNGPTGSPYITIGTTNLAAGIEWTIGPSDSDTATSIANAINTASISGITATDYNNLVYLNQSAFQTVPISSSDPGTLTFSMSQISYFWNIGLSNDDAAAGLAVAINAAAVPDVQASALGAVVSLQQSAAGMVNISCGNASLPTVPGVASRIVLSGSMIRQGWATSSNDSLIAASLVDVINSANIVNGEVAATASGNIVTLSPAEASTLTLSVGNVSSPVTPGASVRLQWSSSELSPGSLVADGISGWLEYVVTDAAIKMAQKEESDTSTLQFQKQALIKRIEAAAENRDAGSPATIADVQWTNGTWPFGNGFGGGGGIP